MKLAVVGAGWAGLTAALTLHRRGHSVHLFEAAHHPGGRARTVHAPAGNNTLVLDNGQHILLGAYSQTLALMHSLGCTPETHLLRLPLTLESADGSTRLRAPLWPAPWHALAALMGAHGPGIKERLLSALPLLLRPRSLAHAGNRGTGAPGDQDAFARPSGKYAARLKATGSQPMETVAQWLVRCRQSTTMVRTLWEPLCLAALNTPVEQACANLFYTVLRDSLTGRADNSHLLIPRTDLGALWPHAALDELRSNPKNTLRFGHTVRSLHTAPTQTAAKGATDRSGLSIRVDDEPFDSVIVATSVASARRLLGALPADTADQKNYLHGLGAFTFLPIATLNLHLTEPWREAAPMLMLREDRKRKHFGQWLFNQNLLNPNWPQRATVVISDAGEFMACSEVDAVAGIVQQLREQTGRRTHPLPPIDSHTLIIEKRATFAAVPGLWRPSNRSPWPGLWLAGDYTDTGYPAVLEGAVRSGLTAAQGALQASAANAP
jgi:predicted NAD/FAD-binding protein